MTSSPSHDPPAEHPSLDELFAYRAGQLAAEAAEEVAEHLSQCPVCSARLLEIADFEGSVASATGPATQRERAWERLSAAIRAPSAAPVPVSETAAERTAPGRAANARGRGGSPRLAWTVAAVLALAALALTVVGGSALQRIRQRAVTAERSLQETRTERQRLADRVAAMTDRLGTSEAALAEARKLLEESRGERSAQIPDGGWPARITVAVQPLFRQRGETIELLAPGDEPAELRPPDSGEPLILHADLTALAGYPQVILQLTDHRDRILWWQRLPGSRLTGDLGSRFEIRGLPTGSYTLTVEGWSADDSAERTLRFELLG
jgi:hypothetical protein